MNVSGLSSVGSVDVRDRVGIAVAAKSINEARRQGDAMVALLRDASDFARSEAGDGGGPSSDGGLDVYA